MKENLLLISNSTNAGENYLEWPRQHIKDFLDSYGIRKVLFIPYAGVNLSPESIKNSFDAYEKRVADVFAGLGFELESIHGKSNPQKAVKKAGAIVVGGGNTFHLVKMMHKTGIMKAIRKRCREGIPYVGWSAGANVACPSMKTTNDMPISEPESFDCLDLVPFQINPHYLDANPAGHGGETREQRILEFLAVNRKMTVVGLREASLFRIEGKSIRLLGSRPLRVFRHGAGPQEIEPGGDVSFLLFSV
jgi:dipeptidase E